MNYNNRECSAEIAGLVDRLKDAAKSKHIAMMWPCVSEAAAALTALQAQNERLRGERQLLAEAICGGEDIPGLLESTPVEALVDIARKTHRDHNEEIDARIKAKAEREAWKANAEALAVQLRSFSSDYYWSDEDTAALSAHAKLKGDV